jgi:hypothetical protein
MGTLHGNVGSKLRAFMLNKTRTCCQNEAPGMRGSLVMQNSLFLHV